MSEKIVMHGIILSGMPVGEADRRLVILTGERGKITAFARGSRRPSSPLVGSTRAFTYGRMELYESKNYYVLDSVEAGNYFEEVTRDLESSCYAAYFCELAGFYGREGLEARESVRLLYAALLALQKKLVSNELIRAAYELRLMVINGEYTEQPFGGERAVVQSAKAAWTHCISGRLEELFTFELKDDARTDFLGAVESLREDFIPQQFKSLEILKSMI